MISKERERELLAQLERAQEAETVIKQVREHIAVMAENAQYGDIKQLSELTGWSRETLRKLSKTYYRSVIRHTDDGRALIKMPSDNVHPDVKYEIRGTDHETVIGTATGQQLLDERRRQLAGYLDDDPEHTNISVVDVSSLITKKPEPSER